MRKKATMAAIAVAEAAALAEQAKKAAEAARLGAARQLAEAGAHRAHSNGSEALVGVPQATCELCLFGEVIGSKKADRMISCPGCKKRYHRNCLKRWAKNRDLFNWSSWVCGFCRICEVCRRTGEPNKLMFCKRCDGAYHAYCQQPPVKQVPKGPFLCPKHTSCHSCAARVPGSGVSSRWFLAYTTCDSCGRLFMRDKYCPICLKVYRDSEASPMVCCDSCEHWVHCQCDGISEEKYHEFQLDHDLHYKCAACRGDCYRVKDVDDAADELWRRRDLAERDIILHNQDAAGLPSKDELLKLSPSSDDDGEDYVTVPVEDRLLKKIKKTQPLKVKEQEGKSPIKPELAKKKNQKIDKGGSGGNIKKFKITLPKSNVLHLSLNKNKVNLASTVEDRSLKKIVKTQPLKVKEQEGKSPIKPELAKKKNQRIDKGGSGGNIKKLKITLPKSNVLHLSSRNKNKVKKKLPSVLTSTMEDSLEGQRGTDQYGSDTEETESEGPYEHDLPSHEGRDGFRNSCHEEDGDMQISGQDLGDSSPIHSWGVHGDIVRRRSLPSTKYRDMDTSVRKAIKVPKESFNLSEKRGNSNMTRLESVYVNEELDSNDTASGKQGNSWKVFKKVRRERETGFLDTSAVSQDGDFSGVKRKKLKMSDLGGKSAEEQGRLFETGNRDSSSKVSLKLKLKKPVGGNGVHLGSAEETSPKHGGGSTIRGQRSKRKKHHLLETGKLSSLEQEGELHVTRDEDGKISDDSWILQKLGRDAIDKRVEVFRPRDRSWCKGTVTEVLPLKSQFTVSSDDGRQETIAFGERSVRILSHSKKHPRS